MDNYLDMARATRVVDFIETLRIPEGMDYGKPFRLRDWQRPIITDAITMSHWMTLLNRFIGPPNPDP